MCFPILGMVWVKRWDRCKTEWCKHILDNGGRRRVRPTLWNLFPERLSYHLQLLTKETIVPFKWNVKQFISILKYKITTKMLMINWSIFHLHLGSSYQYGHSRIHYWKLHMFHHKNWHIQSFYTRRMKYNIQYLNKIDIMNVPRLSCWEKKRLSLECGKILENSIHCLGESHVQASIGLVQHETATGMGKINRNLQICSVH